MNLNKRNEKMIEIKINRSKKNRLKGIKIQRNINKLNYLCKNKYFFHISHIKLFTFNKLFKKNTAFTIFI